MVSVMDVLCERLFFLVKCMYLYLYGVLCTVYCVGIITRLAAVSVARDPEGRDP